MFPIKCGEIVIDNCWSNVENFFSVCDGFRLSSIMAFWKFPSSSSLTNNIVTSTFTDVHCDVGLIKKHWMGDSLTVHFLSR